MCKPLLRCRLADVGIKTLLCPFLVSDLSRLVCDVDRSTTPSSNVKVQPTGVTHCNCGCTVGPCRALGARKRCDLSPLTATAAPADDSSTKSGEEAAATTKIMSKLQPEGPDHWLA